MEVAALSSAISTQAMMGLLVTKVLDQATALIQQQQGTLVAQANVAAASQAISDSLGQNIDVTA